MINIPILKMVNIYAFYHFFPIFVTQLITKVLEYLQWGKAYSLMKESPNEQINVPS